MGSSCMGLLGVGLFSRAGGGFEGVGFSFASRWRGAPPIFRHGGASALALAWVFGVLRSGSGAQGLEGLGVQMLPGIGGAEFETVYTRLCKRSFH